jgi:hypothetical protein
VAEYELQFLEVLGTATKNLRITVLRAEICIQTRSSRLSASHLIAVLSNWHGDRRIEIHRAAISYAYCVKLAVVP